MKANNLPDKTSHTLLSQDEKQAIHVAIERYKQTGKLVSLKEIEKVKLKRKPGPA